ncbi:MAG: magnesium and cobalt transport protein CorA [Azoarcus sp.]|jgi:magnesium transporter|nr:magnesium and cobalt transport protein CorA [Azoarcus sp.]
MLVHCTACQHGKNFADIPPDGIAACLEQPDGFVWVALRDAGGEELARMQEIFGLHDLAIEDANHGRQRPKIEEYDGGLFAVMRLVEEREAAEKEKADGKERELRFHAGEMHVFVGPRYIVSIQNNFRHDFSGVRARCEREAKSLALGPGYVLYALMDAVVDSYFPLVERLETAAEHMEERIFTHGGGLNTHSGIRRLYRLKRRAAVLKHAVMPLMEAAGHLRGGRAPGVCVKSRHYFRDVYDHLQRINSALDNVRDAVATAIQVKLALVAIDQTEISKRLAAWAGIFAVVTALAGIWGMNFAHMPELRWEYGYPAALVLIAGGGGALYWRFRKAGWL